MHAIQQSSVVIYSRSEESSGLGSGVIVSINGQIYIITNAHCVEHVRAISVETADSDFLTATVVGTDENTDVAVLRVDNPANLQPVVLGNSDNVRACDTVDTVGSPLDSSLKFTITRGIISLVETFSLSTLPCFQIDAPINPGNSGGGLFNEAGELIGINASGIDGANIGFALKINDVMRIANQILTYGGAILSGLYFGAKDLDPILTEALGLRQTRGVLVDMLDERCISSTVLMFGDVITHIGDVTIRASENAVYALQKYAGQSVEIRLVRNRLPLRVMLDVPAMQMASSHAPTFNAYGLALEADPQVGLLVTVVDAGSYAEQGNFEAGDILLAINTPKGWVKVKTMASFLKHAESCGAEAFLVKVDAQGMTTLRGLKKNASE